MPRYIRNLSESNTYHIVLKGMNAQDIFLDAQDHLNFLQILKKSCTAYNASLYAYCLMRNHVHLLVHFSENNMAQMFKSFGASFVFRYNTKYNRVGGLFNGRYYSKEVEDDTYLLTVLKYIHYNPVKAGLCNNPADWEWSSYREYFADTAQFADTDFIKQMLTEKQFLELHQIVQQDVFDRLVIDQSVWKVSDQELKNIIGVLRDSYSTDALAIQFKRAKIPAYRIAKLLGIPRDCAYKIP